jgi:dipeptidyl-peptidase-4
MKMYKFLILFFLSGVFTLTGQKKELTLKEAILAQRSTLAPERINGLQWIPGTDTYVFIKANKLKAGSIKGDKTTDLLSLEILNKNAGLKKELKRFPNISWTDQDHFYFRSGNSYVQYDLQSKTFKTYTFNEKAAGNDLNRSTFNLAYTIENNLFIRRADGEVDQISNETDKGIVCGQTVHRSEFGITKGTFWSPKGNKLAFYRKDERMVTDYPLIDMKVRPARVNLIKYPMAGMKSHHVPLGVYDLKNKKTVYIKTGEPKEQYLTAVTWSPDEKSIFIGILNRDQNHLKMNQYNAETGDFIKTLFEERDEQYVEPEEGLIFVPGHDDQFLWFSNRDNYKQLYLYETSGKLLRKVTHGNWDITAFLGFDKKNDLYFQAATDYALNRQIFRVSLKGKQEQITKKKGTHTAQISSDGLLIDTFSSVDTPKEISIIGNKSKKIKELLRSKDPLQNYACSRPAIIHLEDKAGFRLNARMIRPSNFDQYKKYPVLVYVYGGSHAQMVRNTWLGAAPMWMYYLAEKGYIVFTLDNRGSHNRSSDFEQATHRNLGDKEMEDQLVGVDYLRTLPYVDAERMAVHGWSFGGFMTTSLMLRQPGTFKVGVAGGPVIDWSLYEIMYGERYMDTPQENPEGYKKADLTNYIQNLEGKLLIIHGQVDNVVVPQHSMKLLKSSVDKGVQIDFFTYPGYQHNVRGKDRVHLMQKVINYIEENIGD